MSSALGMNLMPPTSAFQHAGGSATLQKPDEQDSNSATEVTKDNIEEVQEKGKIRESHTSHIIVSNYSYKTVQKFSLVT